MPIHTQPFAYTSKGDREQWTRLVDGFDQLLRLRRHRPGAVTRLAGHFYGRTAGSISSLSMVVRSAAITAILDGTEHITKTALDAVPLDHAAATAGAQIRKGRTFKAPVASGAA